MDNTELYSEYISLKNYVEKCYNAEMNISAIRTYNEYSRVWHLLSREEKDKATEKYNIIKAHE